MSNTQTVLGFDYGTKSIGVAVGQAITGTAQPLKALKARDGIPSWDAIETLLKEWQPDLVIVGLPLDLHGGELEAITPRARKFANRLNGRFGCKVELHDERLTTTEARSSLFEHGGYRALGKGNIDSQSAVIIVESWFENQY
ncbi:Holliday junction resolvase RuvX [Veronia nyctiphanis]|uniref:Putative pre-16S rRNA nuclease n=1 Tax=Veronia nyctiphanis TaxID=1278244 RepID=A0A4Q0YP76_9GAMM|nr:Holliday junction resolvase RuvX [Veronia nyctiphanis]RXJ72295.1 Holliday junction resolvase RuvX [Veronia nyctiphanis]